MYARDGSVKEGNVVGLIDRLLDHSRGEYNTADYTWLGADLSGVIE